MNYFALFTSLVATASAFVVVRPHKASSFAMAQDLFEPSSVDFDRVWHCAGSFGECPVDEIEDLRDGKLPWERIS